MSSEQDLLQLANAIGQLQEQKKLRDAEVDNLRTRLEAHILAVASQMKAIENSLSDTRDMARDVKHISIGVDGRNGLRSAVQELVTDMSAITKDFGFLRQTADNYVDMKTMLFRLFAASAAVLLAQFASAVWYLSAQHSEQQAMRQELNRVISYMDNRQAEATKPLLIK
jgi:hypothetical protein